MIGGGINGCGVARDAAGRGYSVCLCESQDFAGGTSSASTKLIHGGLRYLEHYEFNLVRKALMEREILWAMAPHIVWPMRFVLPHHKGLRPQWLIRLGLFLYDHIGGRKLLPASRKITLAQDVSGNALKDTFKKAFEYSDCWVEDARLVVLNACDAAHHHADIRPRTRVIKAEKKADLWDVDVRNEMTGQTQKLSAKSIVNAAGPGVDHVLSNVFGRNDAKNVRLVRGSHIVVKQKFTHDKCYFFQNTDDRIGFAIPYEENYTLIGTTDVDHDPAQGAPEITPEETNYLLDISNEYFKEPVKREDIVWTFSGVRPLYDDGASKAQEATRDYVLQNESENGQPQLINIIGGKITTYRRLAEVVLEEIEKHIGAKGSPWTATAALPGGDFETTGFPSLVDQLHAQYSFLAHAHVVRLARLYGTKARLILAGTRTIADLGTHFGADLYAAEVSYLIKEEWAMTPDDVLYRRTKLGLRLSNREKQALADFMKAH